MARWLLPGAIAIGRSSIWCATGLNSRDICSMPLLKRLAASRPIQTAAGVLAAEYLRIVWKTNRFVVDPPDGYERFDADPPAIVVFWHGQHLMTPFLSRQHRVKVIISRHRDGENNAIAAVRLGIGTIRGSGSHSGDFFRKGGPRRFLPFFPALHAAYLEAARPRMPI